MRVPLSDHPTVFGALRAMPWSLWSRVGGNYGWLHTHFRSLDRSKILWKLSFREGGIEAKYSVLASRQQLDCNHALYLSHNGTCGGPFRFCQIKWTHTRCLQQNSFELYPMVFFNQLSFKSSWTIPLLKEFRYQAYSNSFWAFSKYIESHSRSPRIVANFFSAS